MLCSVSQLVAVHRSRGHSELHVVARVCVCVLDRALCWQKCNNNRSIGWLVLLQFYGVYAQDQHHPHPDTDSIPNLDRASFTGEESKDSHAEPKEWFYDDDVMHDVGDPFEDRGDSDFDFGKCARV